MEEEKIRKFKDHSGSASDKRNTRNGELKKTFRVRNYQNTNL